MSIVPHEPSSGNAVLQSRVLNVLQALVLAGILAGVKMISDNNDKVGEVRTQVAALSAHVDDVKFELEKVNLQQMHDDITMLKAQQEWDRRRIRNEHSLPQP